MCVGWGSVAASNHDWPPGEEEKNDRREEEGRGVLNTKIIQEISVSGTNKRIRSY